MKRTVDPAGGPRRRSVFTARLVNSSVDGHPDVLADLRGAILAGDEPPGTLIPIDAVARFFGVSQIPVREALKILFGEGLVEHTPHVGYSVAKLTFEEFSELYDVRQALEASALRRSVARASLMDDDTVRTVYGEMGDAIDAADERGYHALSRRFHIALIAPSRMHRLLRMYESAWNITEPARPMSRVTPDGQMQFQDEHRHLLEAFVARDIDTLVEESQLHYEHLKQAIGEFAGNGEMFRPSD
jgi:DNA-binding GntR family transcriptional regulator